MEPELLERRHPVLRVSALMGTGGDQRIGCGLITNMDSLSKPLLGTNLVPGALPGSGDAKTNWAPTLALEGSGEGGMCKWRV